MSIDALYNELEQARQTWMGIYNLLQEGKYDFSSPRPVLDSQPIQIFHQRVLIVFEGLFSVRPTDPLSPQGVILAGKTSEIRPALQSFQTHGQSTLSTLRQFWRDGATIRDGNSNFSFQVFLDDSNIGNFDGASNFAQLQSALNQLTTHLALLLPLCKAEAIGDLSERARALGDLVRDAESLRTQASQLATAAGQSADNAAEREKAAQNALAQADAVLAKIQALQQQATTDTGNVAALVEKIKSVGANADTLEGLITGYKSKFDAFQKQLDDRNASFTKFEQDTKTADEMNEKREADIDRLTKLADTMITGATTAGLSTSLEGTRLRYEERMNGAKRGFQWSVALLLVSALPMAAYLLPGLFGSWIPAIDPKVDGSLYAVLGKIVLLLPATWLTAFFTKSYADFFHLEREYAHKAALAMSVDGFKRQAEKYQEEITAEVFMEIRTNPAAKPAPEPASHPLYDILSKTVGKVLDRGEKKD